jgi:dihydrofolate synthase/folylpolyglutamate synthase
MLADKDIDATVAHLRQRVDHWLCVDLPGPRGSSAQSLADRLHAAGIRPGHGDDAQRSITCFASPREGLQRARALAEENDRIVVFGSFLTVADVLSDRSGQTS